MDEPIGYRVSVNGHDSGGAFAITEKVAITAAHVIREARSPSQVTLSGQNIPVVSFIRDEHLDLAALTLKEPVSATLVVDAMKGDRWAIHIPPKPDDPYLSGVVDVATREFKNAKGYPQRVVQLRVHQAVKGFEGYSGSAVYLPELEDAVIAILTEQQLERTRRTAGAGKPSAANVLYAVPVAEALRRFDLEAHCRKYSRTSANVTINLQSTTKQRSAITDLIVYGKDIIRRLEAHILPSGEVQIPSAVDQRVTVIELDNWDRMVRRILSAGFSEVVMGRYDTARDLWLRQTDREEGSEVTRSLTRTKSIVSLLQDLEV